MSPDSDITTGAKESRFVNEVELNNTYSVALNDLWVIRSGIREVEVLSDLGELVPALTSLEAVSAKVSTFEDLFPGTLLLDDIRKLLHSTTSNINKRIDDAWNDAITLSHDPTNNLTRLVVSRAIEPLNLDGVVEAVQSVDDRKPKSRFDVLFDNLEGNIIDPILFYKVSDVSYSDNQLTVVLAAKAATTVDSLISSLEACIKFLFESFSSTILYPLIAKRLATSVEQKLINKSLPALFPSKSDGFDNFAKQLNRLYDFEKILLELKWTKSIELGVWVRNFPNEWASYRKSCYLQQIRNQMGQGFDTLRKVDVEYSSLLKRAKQVSQGIRDESSNNNNRDNNNGNNNNSKEDAEDWNNEWNDEDDEAAPVRNEDKDDTKDSADFDDWGWGDEGEANGVSGHDKPEASFSKLSNVSIKSQRLVTENNKDTVVPSQLYCTYSTNVEMLLKVIKDFSDEIGGSQDNISWHIGDVLALFRGLSTIYYAGVEQQLVLVNDIKALFVELDRTDFKGYVTTSDKETVQNFSLYIVNKLIDEKRESLTSILTVANKFNDCNARGNLKNVGLALERSLDLLKTSFFEWSKVASFCQVARMVGTLNETLVSYMIESIESQSDISEEESNQLVCLIDRVACIDVLFNSPIGNELKQEENSSLAAFYTPSWIKFQYMGEILKSNLADILFMFNEGTLIDFSSSELVGLIRALFSESEHRQRAINEILEM